MFSWSKALASHSFLCLLILTVDTFKHLYQSYVIYSCVNLIGIIVTCIFKDYVKMYSLLVAQMVKNVRAMQEAWVQSLGWKDPLEKGMATHSSICAWRIPWTEKPGGLQSMGSQRAGHDWVTKQVQTLHTLLVLK